MQAQEAYIGSEQGLEVHIREKQTRELQDVLSRHLPLFYGRAYRHLGNAADAEDAVQDALLSAYKHLDQFKGQAQMSTWLTAIVTNCARMYLRRRPHGRSTCRSMSNSGRSRNIPWQNDWRTVHQVLKMNIGNRSCMRVSSNSLGSSRLPCVKHSSCVSWMA